MSSSNKGNASSTPQGKPGKDAGNAAEERRATPPRGLDEGRSGGELNFEDNDIAHPNGKTGGRGGTWEANGGDSGALKPPSEIQSNHIGPSDPDTSRKGVE